MSAPSQRFHGPERASIVSTEARRGAGRIRRAASGIVIAAAAIAMSLVVPLTVRSAPDGASDSPRSSQARGSVSTPNRLFDDSACVTEMSRVVAPTSLLVGETVDVTTSIRFNCPVGDISLHAVILLDASGSTAGETLEDAKAAILDLVGAIGVGSDERTKVGLVAFDDSIKVSCPLTGDRDELVACLDRVSASGGSAIDLGIVEGLRLLREGRSGLGVDGEAREVMILLSEGGSSTGCDPVLERANMVKGEGILFVSVALGGASDLDCLRRAASSPRYFFAVGESRALHAVFDTIRTTIGAAVVRLEIADQPPAALRLVPGSASPEATIDPATGKLTWSMSFVPPEGVTVNFQLEAIDAGRHRTSASATADFVDAEGDTGHVDFPVDDVDVEEGTSSPDAPGVDVQLEIEKHTLAMGERSTGSLAVDVDLPDVPGRTHLMLVLDTSGSMVGEALAAQKAGVHALLDELEAEADPAFRAGLVAFNSSAELLCPLSRDFDALRACVDVMEAGGGTFIPLGLALASDALVAGRPSPGQEDIVLVSDGASATGCGPWHTLAEAIKADGTTIHTIALGLGSDIECMRRVATSPAHFRFVPLAADLMTAYADTSAELLSLRPVESAFLRLDLPPHLAFDPSAFVPPPDELSERSAVWDVRRLADPALVIQFSVEALSEGAGEPSASVRIHFENGTRRTETADGPSIVVGAAGPSTATPRPTVPVSPTTVSTTPTLVPPSGKTPGPGLTVFLPISLNESCISWHPADIAIVLDTSTSMGEIGPDGVAKIDGARTAVQALIDGLIPDRDRVGLIAFDEAARVLHPLAADLGGIARALDEITLGPNTAIDAGIDEARRMLLEGASGAAPERGVSIIVLLTDGRPFPGPASAAIEAAERARSDGIVFFVVGLGPEIDEPTLISIAGGPDAYRAAKDRATLIAAFRTVARWIDCGPPNAFWGRRSTD